MPFRLLAADRTRHPICRRLTKLRKHFNPDEKHGNFGLPDHGHQNVRCCNPPCGPHSHATDKHVERVIHGHCRFQRDQHFAEIGRALVWTRGGPANPLPHDL